MSKENQRKIWYLYQILQKYSDEDHPLSTKQLIELMEKDYQIQIHRETVSKYIKDLIANGIDIMVLRSRNNQYYMSERIFELPELKLLVDAVESSRFISKSKSQVLIEKLTSLASGADAEKLKRNVYTAGKTKALNQKILYIIDVIHQAINSGKRISFQYTDYDAGKNQVLHNDGEEYVLSPYALIWNDDYYYLLGYNHSKEHIATFRVDRISKAPTILDDAIVPMPEDFDISEYASVVFQMYDTEQPTTVTLLCENDLMKHVIDRFGIDVETQVVDPQHFQASVLVCPSPNFYRWVFGWCSKMKILGPPEVVECYHQMAQLALQ